MQYTAAVLLSAYGPWDNNEGVKRAVGRRSGVILARLIPVLLCMCASGRAFPDDSTAVKSPPRYSGVTGVIKKIGRAAETVTVEAPDGKSTRVALPAGVRVQRIISLDELSEGESIHVKFSTSGGKDEIGTAQIDRYHPPPVSGSWDGRPLPEPPRRYKGILRAVDAASRRLAIERIDGEVRWFSVSKRALIIVIGPPDILAEGDAATIIIRGPAATGRPVLVTAESAGMRNKP